MTGKALAGKVAIVTGGGRGIGLAIARLLAEDGASVVVSGRDAARLDAAVMELEALGVTALAVPADAGKREDVDRLIEATRERFGRIDVAVNNAGITRDQLLVRMKDDDWDQVIETNLRGVFLMTRAAGKVMMRQRSGRIISIASSIAHNGAREFADYAASKAAIIGFVKALARELGPDGITVNAICPGSANTDMPRRHRSEEETMARLRATPLGHVLEPEDIAGPILFLASDAAAYITGQTYNINCGTVMI